MNILIVDDIVINRYIIREIVKKLGYKSWEAGNGKIAMDLLKENQFDVIFLDIEMPVMNGMETARAIRLLPSPKNKIKIIAITAYNPSIIHDELNMTDFDSIITKPYSIEKIKESLVLL